MIRAEARRILEKERKRRIREEIAKNREKYEARNVEVVKVVETEKVVQTAELRLTYAMASCVISLGELVVAGCNDGNARVYYRNTSRTAHVVFTEHNYAISCMARLKDDLVVSLDRDGQMFTWRPFTNEKIGSWKDKDGYEPKAVAKLDEERLILGTAGGDLIVLSHSCGANLKLEGTVAGGHCSFINSIFVKNGVAVSCSADRTVKVWSNPSLNLLAVLPTKDIALGVTISDMNIVTVCSGGRIYVHGNARPYRLESILELPSLDLFSVICLNSDIIAVSDCDCCVNFVSLSNKSCLSRVKSSNNSLPCSIAVLSNNRIAAADIYSCKLFRPPRHVWCAVGDYISSMYGKPAPDPATTHPILHAWDSVHRQSLSLVDACRSVIKSENVTKSLEEWCVAHDLLMQAVNTGDIPRSRDYNGIRLHWHRELYQHCDKLAIGEKDIGILISLFREAEEVGVIAEGTCESFVYAVEIRKDIDECDRTVFFDITCFRSSLII